MQRPEMPERGGWPLLTVETKTTGDSRSTYEGAPSIIGSLGLLCQYKIFLSCHALASLLGPVQIFVFLHHTLFHIISPHHQASCTAKKFIGNRLSRMKSASLLMQNIISNIGIFLQWWANLDQASKHLEVFRFRDLSPTPIP